MGARILKAMGISVGRWVGLMAAAGVAVVMAAQVTGAGASSEDALTMLDKFKWVMIERESSWENIVVEYKRHSERVGGPKANTTMESSVRLTYADPRFRTGRAIVKNTVTTARGTEISESIEINTPEKGLILSAAQQAALLCRQTPMVMDDYNPARTYLSPVLGRGWTEILNERESVDAKLEGGFLSFRSVDPDDDGKGGWVKVVVDCQDLSIVRVEQYADGELREVKEFTGYTDIGDGFMFPYQQKRWIYARGSGVTEFDSKKARGYWVFEVSEASINTEISEELFKMEIPTGYKVRDSISGLTYTQGSGTVPADVMVEAVVDDAMENFGEEMVEEVREVAAGPEIEEEPVAEEAVAAEAPEDEETRWALMLAVAVLAAAAVATVMVVAKKRARTGK